MPIQRGRITSWVKYHVRERDGHKCVDCGSEPGAGDNWPVHRLVPGSPYTLEGCVTVCYKCHARRHMVLRGVDPSARSEPGRKALPLLGVSRPVHMQGELWEMIGLGADAANMSSNAFIAQILASYYGRPDLATIPRRGFGHRPRKPAVNGD